ncbi:MAG: hypothetical protein AAFZ80_10865 [Cyanobacteria bacterium P01_A01_bin.105]
MSLPKAEARQLLERLIFEETDPKDWVEDVWSLSALHGDGAAKLLEVFEALIECCSEEKLDNLVQSMYQEKLEQSL